MAKILRSCYYPPPMTNSDHLPDIAYWVSLSGFFGGPRLRKLWERFDSGAAAWRAGRENLSRLNFTPETIEKFLDWRQKTEPAECLKILNAEAIKVVMLNDPEYPPALQKLIDSPAILFYKGALPAEANTLAIVGTRKPTVYGRTVALNMAREAAAAGLTIISGLARGIDAIAHEAALERGGRAVAVIGSGLDRAGLYPPEHWGLAENIISSGGCVISEYPPLTKPAAHQFPERNRIIAGLAAATLVVEAPEKSGALITAFQALEYGREVLAIPGPITEPNAAGTNRLLKLGAHVITSPTDLLNFFNLSDRRATAPAPAISPDEQNILKLFSSVPQTIDDVANKSSLPIAKILINVSSLELAGLIQDVGGRRYIILSGG